VESFPSSIVVGDFKSDGKLDLAIGYSTGSVGVYLGNGDGTFDQAPGSPVSGAGLSLVAGDFNNDGKLDLAGIDNSNDVIDIFQGAGDGTFSEIVTTPVVSQTVLGPSAIVAADFNEDGVSDLALLTNFVDTASILLAEPTQTATATANSLAPVGAGTHNVEASYPGDSNYPSSISSTVALTAGLVPVVISPANGTYSTVQTVMMSETIPGATIYYEASGPVSTNGYVQYTGPFTIPTGGYEFINAYAAETGYQQSFYSTANYILNYPQAPAPTITLAPGSYANTQTTTISDSVQGATIYYTTNGTLPGTSSTQYSGQLTISSSETLVATAIATGYSMSLPASAQYIIDSAPSSFIYTYAGNGTAGYTGDGGPATLADINFAASTAEDQAGNLYIADENNNVVRKVAAGTGMITTFAGNGTPGYSGDGGQATQAQLSSPISLAIDGAGNLYISDNGNNAVRKVTAATGAITTYTSGIEYPQGIAVDGLGNLFVAEPGANTVWKVAAGTGTITAYAGSVLRGYSGDGGLATNATLSGPIALATDGASNLYIADLYNNVIRKVSAGNQVISTFAGSRQGGYSGDGGPATKAEINYPSGVAVDRFGNVYIADTDNAVIREVSANSGTISTVAGNGVICSIYSGDGGPASNSGLCLPSGISVDASGNLFITDNSTNRVREVTVPALPPTTAAAAPAFTVAAGIYDSPQSVIITDATPGAAIYITLDGTTPTTLSQGYNGPINVSGNLTISAIALAPGYLASAPSSAAYTIISPPTATITTIAGNGTNGFTQAGGPAASVEFSDTEGLARDSAGNIYFADSGNNVVWMLSAQTGDLSVAAGNGKYGYSGDAGPATSAELAYPQGVAVDGAGNLFIVDSGNDVVREVSAATGYITTYAGKRNAAYSANYGDGGPAIDAELSFPEGLAVDEAGNLYIAETGGNAVRMVTASTGIISTYAGNRKPGYSGDGGAATSAAIGEPSALAIDGIGNLYIVTTYARVRMVSSTGIITTVAGNGDPGGNDGDGGPATSAEIYPQGIAVDSAGNLYISTSPGAIRQVAAGAGIITTVAGNGYFGFTGDGAAATIAEIAFPQGVACDAAGNLYFADSGNHRIRQVTFSGPAATPIFSLAAGTYSSSLSVSIIDGTPGATIYYTTDGSPPTTKSNTYSSPITVTNSETLQSMAVVSGRPSSAVATAAYTITTAIPVISPPPGTYLGAQMVTITDATQGAAIYYTTDGVTLPTTEAELYSGPIAVNSSQTIMAIAVANGFPSSPVASATYNLKFQPTITWATPAPITYGTALEAKQLDAEATVAGTFVYEPKLGTKLDAGTQTLTVKFMPANPSLYTGAIKTVQITVKKAALTFAGGKLTKVYGAELLRLSYTTTGYENGDTAAKAFTGKPAVTTKATEKSPVGRYGIAISTGTLKSVDYEFEFIDGELTITKAELTVSAKNISVALDKPIPKLTYAAKGFANGDTTKVLSGKPDETTTAKQGAKPGTYAIVIKQDTLRATNYNFTFKNGKVTITPP
jgi:sugar lactone lactonase YvrE